MPESFENLLSEMADAAVHGTPVPAPAAVRARGRQRTVRRRALVSAFALVLIAGGAGTGVALVGRASPAVPPASRPIGVDVNGTAPAPQASTPPVLTSSGVPGETEAQAARRASTPPALITSPSPSRVVGPYGVPAPTSTPPATGIWEATTGSTTTMFAAYPDGYLGLATPGNWYLCFAALGRPTGNAGQYQVDTDGCLINDMPATTVTFEPGGGVAVQEGSTVQDYTYDLPLGGPTKITGPASVAGTWPKTMDPSVDPDRRSLVIAADGTVQWSEQLYDIVLHGKGSLGQLSGGGYRMVLDCGHGDPASAVSTVPPPGPVVPCGILQIQLAQDGNLLVYGGDGRSTLSWQ